MAVILVFWMIMVLVIMQEADAQIGSMAKPGCEETCGSITIPYPFGIGANCSGNYNFTITCDSSYTPLRPFLNSSSSSLEVIRISLFEGTISVSNTDITDRNGSLPFPSTSVNNRTRFTAVLDWRTYWKCGSLPALTNSSTYNSSCGANAFCSGQGCSCVEGYQGNPYISTGCQDIDECNQPTGYYNGTAYYNGTIFYGNGTTYNVAYLCNQICTNIPGSYNCSCYSGYKLSAGSRGYCYKVDDKRNRMVIVGICSCIGGLILVGVTWWLYKLLQRRKEKKLKEKYFQKNGGLLLEQQISSSEGNVEKSKLFTSKELEKATDHYNEDRILGQGGQGTVYKGMLTDGRIVAVKKSKIEGESELEPFINEVVILSKIDHRNIVKLHGCCLETEVPLLVYEFIPNGTLFRYIHEQNEDFPLSWDVRVRVAKEVAGALFYLHSSASIPIYHRDIKSTNILLDEKYRAKVADFGISRSTAIDQTHLTTRVLGTFGYLDPEYFQSSQFTDKSDVYSFGVVLVELLTGQKPISSGRSEDETRSLATFFILAMEQDRLLDILDPRVMKDGRKEEILGFANLAHRCLNLNGRKRPTMRQVAMELEGITPSIGATSPHQHYDEVEYAAAELMGPWETSTSMESSSTNSTSLDVEPLLHAPS